MEPIDFEKLRDCLRTTMSSARTNALVNQLDDMVSYEDVFCYFWNLHEVQQCLNEPYPRKGKSEEAAEAFKARANYLRDRKKYMDALRFYNKSIRVAPHPEMSISSNDPDQEEPEYGINEGDKRTYKQLAFAYANRSQVLFTIGEKGLCLQDLELSSICGYSGPLGIQQKKKQYQKETKQRVMACVSGSGASVTPGEICRITKPNPNIPSFSKALKAVYSTSKGMHVLAARDIRPGEVLVVEKSYCSRLYFNEENNYCPVCFERYISLIPCPTCSLYVFCSVTCRRKGLRAHQRECKIISVLEPLGLFQDIPASVAVMALISTPFWKLKEKLPLLLRESLELPPEKLGFDEKGIFNPHDYRAVYHMAGARRKMCSHQSLFTSLITAYVVIKVLMESGTYFVDSSGVPFTPSADDLKMTGSVLLHHLCVYPHSYNLYDMKRAIMDKGAKNIGYGLFPSAIFIRHSCDAPTVQYSIRDVMVVRAVRPIALGQEVTVSRGDFLATTTYVRKMQFGSLGIECVCAACEEDWPVYNHFPLEFRLKCIKCRKPLLGPVHAPVCPTCKLDYNFLTGKGEKKAIRKKWISLTNRLSEADRRFSRVQHKINSGQTLTKDDFRATCYFAELLSANVKPPCAAFYNVTQTLRVFFAEGNKFLV